jgi:hypothetical protein
MPPGTASSPLTRVPRLVADIAWTYQDPPDDAARVPGLIAFFDEKTDTALDGKSLERRWPSGRSRPTGGSAPGLVSSPPVR